MFALRSNSVRERRNHCTFAIRSGGNRRDIPLYIFVFAVGGDVKRACGTVHCQSAGLEQANTRLLGLVNFRRHYFVIASKPVNELKCLDRLWVIKGGALTIRREHPSAILV